MSDIYIGVYWGGRRESAVECAKRAKRMFTRLSKYDAYLHWYRQGGGRKNAIKHKVNVHDEGELTRLFEGGESRTDANAQIMEDLGYNVVLWNGATRKMSVSISIACGLYCDNPNLSNAVVLNTPKEPDGLVSMEAMLDVFKSIVEAWTPDYGGVIDRVARKFRNFTAGAPFVDWMTYISNKEIHVENLPMSAKAFRAGAGWIVVTQREPIESSNTEHIRNVHAVEKLIFGSY